MIICELPPERTLRRWVLQQHTYSRVKYSLQIQQKRGTSLQNLGSGSSSTPREAACEARRDQETYGHTAAVRDETKRGRSCLSTQKPVPVKKPPKIGPIHPRRSQGCRYRASPPPRSAVDEEASNQEICTHGGRQQLNKTRQALLEHPKAPPCQNRQRSTGYTPHTTNQQHVSVGRADPRRSALDDAENGREARTSNTRRRSRSWVARSLSKAHDTDQKRQTDVTDTTHPRDTVTAEVIVQKSSPFSFSPMRNCRPGARASGCSHGSGGSTSRGCWQERSRVTTLDPAGRAGAGHSAEGICVRQPRDQLAPLACATRLSPVLECRCYTCPLPMLVAHLPRLAPFQAGVACVALPLG